MELTAQAWFYFLASAAVVGFAKTSVGGMGILAVTLMALAFPGKASPGILLPMLVMADIIAVMYYRRDVDRALLMKIFPAAAFGVIGGYLFVAIMPNANFDRIIGAIILFMLAIGLIVEHYKSVLASVRSTSGIVGALAGAASMIANAAGPVFGIYMLQLGLTKERFVGTRAFFFLALNLFKLPFSAGLGLITSQSLMLNLYAVPVILIGGLAGAAFLKLINVTVFKYFIRTAALIAALRLLFW